MSSKVVISVPVAATGRLSRDLNDFENVVLDRAWEDTT